MDLSHCNQLNDHAISSLARLISVKRRNLSSASSPFPSSFPNHDVTSCHDISPAKRRKGDQHSGDDQEELAMHGEGDAEDDYANASLDDYFQKSGIDSTEITEKARIEDVGGNGSEGTNRNKYLRELSLSKCTLLTSVSCEHIGTYMRGLTALDLSFCEKITDRGVRLITQGCPSLHTLSLKRLRDITDVSLQCVADNLPLIKHLDLTWCREVTDGGLSHLARRYGLSLSMSINPSSDQCIGQSFYLSIYH